MRQAEHLFQALLEWAFFWGYLLDGRRIKGRIQGLLDSLDYDFAQFTMEGFKGWMEGQRGRRITFDPWPMPPQVYGAWITSDTRDYVFYEQSSPPIHQAHIQLHEMAHMLCGHPTIDIHSQQASDLLRHLVGDDASRTEIFLRSVHSDEAELEAEIFASLIQEQALRTAGVQELSKVIASSGDFVTYMASYLDILRRHP